MSSLRGCWWWRLVLAAGLFGFVAEATLAQSPATVPGRIVVAQVRGAVMGLPAGGGAGHALKNGDALGQDWTVNTAPGASVVLVFSNGATVDLGGDSTLAIREYLQEPFAQNYKISTAKEEPSTSTTRLRLVRGELVGNVKHLRLDRGSAFTVETAVGAAGIRGTVFRIVLRADAAGKAVFSLSTDQGEVVLQGINAPAVSVPAGREFHLQFEGTVDPDTGELTVTSGLTIEDNTDAISDDSRQAITDAQTQITDAVENVVVPPTGDIPNSQHQSTVPGADQKRVQPGANLPASPILPPTSNDQSSG